MSIANEVASDINDAKRLRLPWWGVLLGIVVSFLCASVFDDFGRLELILPTLNSVLVIGVVLVLKRKAWRHAWLWGTMAVVAVLHAPLILLVPWTSRWVPAPAIAAIDSLDFCLILGVLAGVEKLIRARKI